MKKLLLTIIILSVTLTVNAYTGKDLICKEINYLSSDCLNAQVLPMEYYDKDVAMEKAKQSYNSETNITQIIQEAQKESKESGEIIIRTYFEKE